jgi:hypothetical protein
MNAFLDMTEFDITTGSLYILPDFTLLLSKANCAGNKLNKKPAIWSFPAVGSGLITYFMELKSQKEKTLTAMALANEAQLQMLRYQLNPHFLFNALNSIRTLVHEDVLKADQMITDLSEFL